MTRDVLPDAILSVSQQGEIQNVYQSFTIDPTWKPQDLWVAIFLQDEDTKAILQSGSSRPAPAYSMRYWAKGARRAVAASRAMVEIEDFAVFNYGTNPDVIRVTMDPGSLPAGWTCVFTDGSNDYSDYLDLALEPGQFEVFHLKVTTSGVGFAQPKIVLTSNNLPTTVREIQYQIVTAGLDVLLVDDDGADTFEEYHMAALEAAGRTYDIWSTNIADVATEVVTPFEVIDWQIGLSYPTLTASDRAALGARLDAGGNLFIIGQDLGWEMNDQGGAAIAWYRQYLHANCVGDNANRNLLTGVSGDPISAGMTLNLSGGDGANNNIYPEMISAYASYATTIFSYDGLSPTRWGALRVTTTFPRSPTSVFRTSRSTTPPIAPCSCHGRWTGSPVSPESKKPTTGSERSRPSRTRPAARRCFAWFSPAAARSGSRAGKRSAGPAPGDRGGPSSRRPMRSASLQGPPVLGRGDTDRARNHRRPFPGLLSGGAVRGSSGQACLGYRRRSSGRIFG